MDDNLTKLLREQKNLNKALFEWIEKIDTKVDLVAEYIGLKDSGKKDSSEASKKS